jgi:hypothetical protein
MLRKTITNAENVRIPKKSAAIAYLNVLHLLNYLLLGDKEEATRKLDQDSQELVRDTNWVPPEC